MGKESNAKTWAMILVIVMVASTFVGFSALAWGGSDTTPDGSATIEPISLDNIKRANTGFDGSQSLNENALNRGVLKDTGPAPMSPPPSPETQGTWTYDFDADTVDQWPSIPPWNYGDTPAGQQMTFPLYDFDTDGVGGNPGAPPWTTVDGSGMDIYWGRDFEDLSPGNAVDMAYIQGDAGAYYTVAGDMTTTAETRPAGTPPGSVYPAMTEGTMAWYYNEAVDAADFSYIGPAGIGEAATTHAFLGGWVYMSGATTRLDFLMSDYGGGDMCRISWFGGDMYEWPGGAPTVIPGPSWAANSWHEMFIEYDEGLQTYSLWWDGTEYIPGTAWDAGVEVSAAIWMGSEGQGNGPSICYIDNFYHFNPPAGFSNSVDVVNSQSHSASNSVFIDQDNEPAGNSISSMSANFNPPVAGTGYWDYWFRTDATAADTNGAIATLYDQEGGDVIAIRANGGDFQYNDGGAWTNALNNFAAGTWYNFNITFDTVARTFNVNIDSAPSGGGTFARDSGTLAGIQYRGTGGTQSEHYIDDVYLTCDGAAANITVTSDYFHSAPNALRFQEYNSGTYGYIGADNLGAGLGGFGTFSLWFMNTENGGGHQWYLDDVNGGSTMTLFAMGVNLATLGPNPGVVQFVNNDGAGFWVVDGPTYNVNEWHQITIDFDCNDFGVSGTTGSYWYRWDGGAQQGPYGMMDPVTYFDMLTCYGGATDTYGDFVYDDFDLFVNAIPGAPTNCWAEPPGGGAGDTYDNFTVNGQFLDHGTITGGDWTDIDEKPPAAPDGNTEDIQEIMIGGPTYTNYTVASDIAVEGNVGGTIGGPGTYYTNVVENDPPDGNVETIEEVAGPALFNIINGESFETAWPAGWTVGAGWTRSTLISSAYHSSLNAESDDGTGDLTSNVMDTSGYDPLQLEFGYIDSGIEAGEGTVWALTSTGWVEILDANGAASWTQYSNTWTFGANPEYFWAGFQLEFRSTGFQANDEWAVDYIWLNGTGAGAPILEHKWTTEAIAPGATSLDLYVRGAAVGADDPTFSIEYSTDDITYLPTGISISGAMTTYGPFGLPLAISGSIWLRIIDDSGADVVADTVSIDQIRIEHVTGIAPQASLEKRWSTENIAASASTLTLYVRARYNTGSDDTFSFGYSTVLGGPYTGVITVNSDVMNTQSVGIPVMSGSIYINVIDDNTGDAQLDTIYVDTIWIEWYQTGGSMTTVQQTTADFPVDGTVVGTHVLTNPPPDAPPDGNSQQISEVTSTKVDNPSPLSPGPGPTPTVDILPLESFETSVPPAGWTMIDADGDGNNWAQTAGAVQQPPHTGEFCAFSESWNGAPYNPDNYLITPLIDLSGYMNTQLTWWDAAQDPLWPNEHYQVKVSTTGNNEADFTNIEFDITLADEVWRQRTVDLSAYDFQQIYVAFVHNLCSDWFQLKIDDVLITADVGGNTLEHVWTMQDMPSDSLTRTLYVTGRFDTGSDDDFTFGWSNVGAGGPFTPLPGCTIVSDVYVTYSDATIPVAFIGPIWIQVIDTNGGDPVQTDTVYIDALWIESEVSGVSTDIVVHWDLSSDDGAGENDIVSYDVYRADEEDGDDVTGPYTFIGSSAAGATTYNDIGEGADLVNQAWYYVEANDGSQTNASGYFSKLNFAPLTSNVMADLTAPILIISPGTPSVTLTADVYDNSSCWEAIPKMNYAEYFVGADPGEGAGTQIDPVDAVWDTMTEQLQGIVDTSTWAPGSYNIYVRGAEDQNGVQVYGATAFVTVQVVDGPPVANAGPDQLVTQHTVVTFDGSLSTDDVGITTYWWNFTDGGAQSLPGVGPSYQFDSEGVFTVTLTVMDTLGRTNSDIMVVNVTDGDPPVAEAGPNQDVTPGTIVTFDGSGSYDPGHLGEPINDGIVNWSWTFDDGTGPQQEWNMNPTHLFNIPGSYLVTLVVKDAAPVPPAPAPFTDTDTMWVNVTEIFDIDITPAAGSADWILISFPNKISGDPLTIVQDQLDYGGGLVTWDVIQTYNSTLGGWITTSTFKPPSLNDFTFVDNYMAFWIHITDYGDGIITLVGDLAATGEGATIPMKAGWNLIGYPFGTPQDMFNTIGTLFTLDANVETYDQANPYRLQVIDVWSVQHVPGEGYWVHIAMDEDLMMWAP